MPPALKSLVEYDTPSLVSSTKQGKGGKGVAAAAKKARDMCVGAAEHTRAAGGHTAKQHKGGAHLLAQHSAENTPAAARRARCRPSSNAAPL
jgi:hypothetical protein